MAHSRVYGGQSKSVTPGNRSDPFLAYNFLVIIDGLTVGSFTDVSGLNIETNVEKKVFGGDNQTEHVFFNNTKYSDITLKRGITDTNLWSWYENVINGIIVRKDGSICLLDHSGYPKIWWDFNEACPIKWEGPSFSASGNSVAAESIVLVNTGVKMYLV